MLHHRIVFLALTGLLLGSCAAPATPRQAPAASRATVPHPPARPTGLPAFSHVFVVVMENLGYRAALGVPQLASLAGRWAVATRYYAVAHPSLPNYLALTSGGTQGVTSDCWFCYRKADNLGEELSDRGISWGAYMEGLPKAGWLGPWWPPGDYAGKHDPFRYYTDIRDSRSLRAHLQPLHQLTKRLSGPASGVPRFVWVTPNLCNDGHDCPPARAAAWLSGFVRQVTASAAWRQGGALFVTWDEGNGADPRGVAGIRVLAHGGGGHVFTLVIAPGLPRDLRVSVPYSHYSLLKTVEEAWGVPLLGQTASPAVQDMAAFWGKLRTGGGR